MLTKDGKFHLPFLGKGSILPEPLTRIFYVTIYGRCGDQLVEIDIVESSLVPDILGSAEPRWELVFQGQGTIRLEEVVDDYCDTHKRWRLITIYKGHLAVFRGKETDPSHLLLERTDIKEMDLQPRDREYLKKGHIIEASPDIPPDRVATYLEEAVALWLEGLMEH